MPAIRLEKVIAHRDQEAINQDFPEQGGSSQQAVEPLGLEPEEGVGSSGIRVAPLHCVEMGREVRGEPVDLLCGQEVLYDDRAVAGERGRNLRRWSIPLERL